MIIIIMNCKRCGHDWTPRSESPVSCPRCKSYEWDREKRHGEASRGGKVPGVQEGLASGKVNDRLGGVVRDVRPLLDEGVRGSAKQREAAKGCPSCGGLNGLHQKGCKGAK